jgi:hypothetical protein
MRRKLPVVTLLLLAVLAALPAQAQYFAVNARALGMGGAYTAIANDIYSAPWNPAGFSYIRGFQFGLTSGQVHQTNVLDILRVLDNFPQNTVEENVNLLKFVAETATESPSDVSLSSATALGGAGFGLTIIPFGAGTIIPRDKDGNIGIKHVHLPNLNIDVPAAGSNVTFDGALGAATSLTYGWKQRNANGLRLGTNLNFLYGGSRFIKITYNGLSLDPIDQENSEGAKKLSLGADVGALYPAAPDVMVGAMLRNLISPGTDELSAPTRLTVGAAWTTLHHRLILSGDIANLFGQTYLNLGAEYKVVDILPLRIGLFRDVPTIGLGISKYFNVAYSPGNSFLSVSLSF